MFLRGYRETNNQTQTILFYGYHEWFDPYYHNGALVELI